MTAETANATAIDRLFQQNRGKAADGHEKILIGYLTLGDPNLETSIQYALAMASAGVDLLELGIPYSDPLADGPTIQAAGQRALQAGFRLNQVFDAAETIRSQTDTVLTIMTYVNPILQSGVEGFAAKAAASGAAGLLVPDLPVEESPRLASTIEDHGLALIQFAAPTSSAGRLRLIAERAQGFVYAVSMTGTTGSNTSFDEVESLVSSIRQYTSIPVGVGFGISSPKDAARAGAQADAVIVGSAFIRIIAEYGDWDLDSGLQRVGDLAQSLKRALIG